MKDKPTSSFIGTIDSYILGLWFSSGHEADFLLRVSKGESENEWMGTYRYRYYKQPAPKINDPFSGEDEKSEWTIKFYDTEENAIKKMDELADFNKAMYPHNAARIIVQGNFFKMISLAKPYPWFHLKIQNKDGEDVSMDEFLKDHPEL